MHVNIVGAGIIGLATALELHTRAHTFTLFDPDPGQGASFAAAGMLAPAAETTWGQGALHRMLAEANAAYPQFVQQIYEVTGQRPDYLRNSTLVVAAEPADREALHELLELQHSLGMRAEKLLPSAARRLEPALASNIAGAVLCTDDHQVDPRSVIRILLEYFNKQLIREPVAQLIGEGARTIGVRTESGAEHYAEQTILAHGLGTVEGLEKLPVRPVYGDILRLQSPPGAPPISHTIRGIVHREQIYLVPRRDGSLVLGASVREDQKAQEQVPAAQAPTVNVGAMTQLLENARKLLPGIRDCTLNEVIARARPATPDDAPLIGRLDPGLVLSTGYSRHGVLLSPLGSNLTAALAEGSTKHPLLPAVDPARFTTVSWHAHRMEQHS